MVPDPAGVRGAWLAYVLAQPGSLSWRDLPVLLDYMSLPLLVGTSMLGSVAGVVTYVVSFHLMSRRRAVAGVVLRGALTRVSWSGPREIGFARSSPRSPCA